MGVAILEADTKAEALLRDRLSQHEHPRVRVVVDEPWPDPVRKAPGLKPAEPPTPGRSQIANSKPPSAPLEARSGKKRGRKRRNQTPAAPER